MDKYGPIGYGLRSRIDDDDLDATSEIQRRAAVTQRPIAIPYFVPIEFANQ